MFLRFNVFILKTLGKWQIHIVIKQIKMAFSFVMQ